MDGAMTGYSQTELLAEIERLRAELQTMTQKRDFWKKQFYSKKQLGRKP